MCLCRDNLQMPKKSVTETTEFETRVRSKNTGEIRKLTFNRRFSSEIRVNDQRGVKKCGDFFREGDVEFGDGEISVGLQTITGVRNENIEK